MSVSEMNIINTALIIPIAIKGININSITYGLLSTLLNDNIFTGNGRYDIVGNFMKDNTINRLNPIPGMAILSSNEIAFNRQVDEISFNSSGIDKLTDNDPYNPTPLFRLKSLTEYQLSNYDPAAHKELEGTPYLQVNSAFIHKYKNWQDILNKIVGIYQMQYGNVLYRLQDSFRREYFGNDPYDASNQ